MSLLCRHLTPKVLLGLQKMRTHVTMVFAWSEPTDVTLFSQTPLVTFYKVYFGGRNVLAYSLIGNRHWMREYRETSGALKRKENIGLKLGLGK